MIDVFIAKKILTMNPSWPIATAVAVRDGSILEVGTLESLQPWLKDTPYRIREEFTDAVIMPGLIDPHLHPVMAAVLLPMQFITALPWDLPWGSTAATVTPEAYLDALHAHAQGDEPFFTWGYHRHWHGELDRACLDSIFGDRPAVVWQRSFHELYMNSAMMSHVGIEADQVRGRPQIDYDRGHFFENGLGYAINKLNPIIMSPAWIDTGLERLKLIVHHGGQTTVGDMAVGLFDVDLERAATARVLDNADTPFRVLCVPHIRRLLGAGGTPEAGIRALEEFRASSTEKFRFTNKVKMFTDGAFFSQLAVLQPPGYIDGHLGEWLMGPEEFEKAARPYWHAGCEIHVHCTGDLGLELALDTLATLQWERPRFEHGFTIEHFGFSTPEQVERILALGARVSANVYYLHELSAAYSEIGVGVERSHQMARLGACERAGVRTALHSDFPMAPAMPLHSAWVAVTRTNCEGEAVGPQERISIEKALRSITIDAAAMLGLENETGSIRAGKKADFAVLDGDPLRGDGTQLKSIRILATVFEGDLHPIQHDA